MRRPKRGPPTRRIISAHLHSGTRSERSFRSYCPRREVRSAVPCRSLGASRSFRLRIGPDRACGVSLASDVIFRELSVNPLSSFFHAIVSLALSRSHHRTALPVFIRLLPLIRSEGRFPGSCPASSTSDVAVFGALESADTNWFRSLYVPY